MEQPTPEQLKVWLSKLRNKNQIRLEEESRIKREEDEKTEIEEGTKFEKERLRKSEKFTKDINTISLTADDKINFNTKYNRYHTLKVVKKIDGFEKDSSSDTNVWFCTLSTRFGETKKVVIKFSEKPKHINNQLYYKTVGLKYETQVYDYIQTNIIDNGECFNFVGYVGCLNPESTKVQAFLQSDTLYTVLITEYNDTVPLSKTLTELAEEKNEDDVIKIFTQIFYTLFVMEKHSLLHCDLHTDNIRIQTLNTSQKMCFKIDDDIFTISSKFVVQIYDWDRSYCKNIGLNSLSQFYHFIPKEDLRKIISMTRKYLPHTINDISPKFPKILQSRLDKCFKHHNNDPNSGNIILTKPIEVMFGSKKVMLEPNEQVYGLWESVDGFSTLSPFNSILLTPEMRDRFLKVIPNDKTIVKFQQYTLFSKHVDYIIGSSNNPFNAYEHGEYTVYDNYMTQHFLEENYSSNILKSLNSPLELFKRFSTSVEECKSDYSVFTTIKLFTPPKTPILLPFFEIEELANTYSDTGLSLYTRFMCAIYLSKITNDIRVAKELLKYLLNINFNYKFYEYDTKLIYDYNLEVKIYPSELLEEYINKHNLTSQKLLRIIDSYHSIENELTQN